MKEAYDYHVAFSRNIGWVTETEQAVLKTRRVAIAGLGGVGGSHLLTLTRLGIEKFSISDLDTFELANFNRQAGASLRHIDQPKVDVLAELALDINPNLDIRLYPKGVNRENLDEFLKDVDLYVDGLDFFAVDTRRAVFAACADNDIPAITAAPLGMGVALLNFLPGKMTFEEYFRLEGQPENEQLVRFLLGLSPAMLQVPYLVDDSRVDLKNHIGPSTSMACELCAGMAATHALKLLLNRGNVPSAPRGIHFDAYRNKMSATWRPGGNNNPLQRLGLIIIRKRLSQKLTIVSSVDEREKLETVIARILDLARWAPSGDNTQPWRFEIIDEMHFLIHAHDTRDWCVYDLDGRASQIAVGALLETIAIAASGERLEAAFNIMDGHPETNPVIRVSLSDSADSQPDRLLPFIKARVTQRRPLSTAPLSARQKNILQQSISEGYEIVWIEGWSQKWRMAKLLFKNAKIRLTIPEAYEVHKQIIQWDAQFSEDRIPDQAVGVDPVTMKLMRWAMKSWERVQMMNRYFAGTLMPRIQLDLVPALACAAHFIIIADKPLKNIEHYLEGGRALQRFWLTAASLGLQFQPEMTPLIFSRYHADSERFTENAKAIRSAADLASQFETFLGQKDIRNTVFMGRLGYGSLPASRSIRLTVGKLMH